MREVYAVAGGGPGRAATPDVDVVVAAHDPRRAVDHAVRSVLDSTDDVDVRVTVVAHNIHPGQIAAALAPATRDDPRVRLLGCADGLGSPSGPFRVGLAAATAQWVSIIGSDDHLEVGAVRTWLAAAARHDADVVLPRLVLAGSTVPTPPTRPWRRHHLDLVRDRLSYRSAPLGLLRRSALQRLGAELVPGAPVGGDVPMATRLWAGARVSRLRTGPAYVIGEEAPERVSYAPRPVTDQLASVRHLVGDPWFVALPARARRAIGTKLLRIHVFGAVLTRSDPGWWSRQERHDLAAAASAIIAAAPGCERPLSLADRALLDACLDPAVPATELLRRAHARRRHGRPGTLVPRDLRYLLHREAPVRFMGASLLARR